MATSSMANTELKCSKESGIKRSLPTYPQNQASTGAAAFIAAVYLHKDFLIVLSLWFSRGKSRTEKTKAGECFTQTAAPRLPALSICLSSPTKTGKERNNAPSRAGKAKGKASCKRQMGCRGFHLSSSLSIQINRRR